MMNRSSARLTQTFLALTVLGGLGIGLAACSDPTTTTSSRSLPTTSTNSAAAPPAPSPAAPSPAAPSPAAPSPAAPPAAKPATVTRSATAPTSATAPRSVTQTRVAGTRTSPVTLSTTCSTQKAWGTRPVFGSLAMSQSPLYLTRVGRHDCYDRVVFDVNGPQAVGLVARYVPVVRADGSGKPVPVAGRAALEVIVRAPILGTDDSGHQPWRPIPRVGESLVTPPAIAGWSSLRAVKFAGSFEGQTTVAVGVRERLPFRAFVTRDGAYQHVVLDIAH
jgi:hypothetical protein